MRCGIELDEGGVRKAKGHSSGQSVQEELAFLRGDEGVGKLCIALVGTDRFDGSELTLKSKNGKRSVHPGPLALRNCVLSLIT